MSEARTSARLRKRPRISYASPPDDPEDATGQHAENENESESSEEEDEEFTLKRRKGKKMKKKSTKMKRGRVTETEEPKPFRFMDLPAELRNAIYDLTLTHPTPLYLRDSYRGKRHAVQLRNSTFEWQHPRSALPTLVPSLLLLNKAIHAESGSILYQNELIFFDCTATWHFLQPLSQTTKSWIERIGLRNLEHGSKSKGYISPAFHSLIALPNLRSLQLMDNSPLDDYSQGYFIRRLLPLFLREAYIWMDAVGKAKKDKYAAVELLTVNTTDREVTRYNRAPRSPTKFLISQEDIEQGNRKMRELIRARF